MCFISNLNTTRFSAEHFTYWQKVNYRRSTSHTPFDILKRRNPTPLILRTDVYQLYNSNIHLHNIFSCSSNRELITSDDDLLHFSVTQFEQEVVLSTKFVTGFCKWKLYNDYSSIVIMLNTCLIYILIQICILTKKNKCFSSNF